MSKESVCLVLGIEGPDQIEPITQGLPELNGETDRIVLVSPSDVQDWENPCWNLFKNKPMDPTSGTQSSRAVGPRVLRVTWPAASNHPTIVNRGFEGGVLVRDHAHLRFVCHAGLRWHVILGLYVTAQELSLGDREVEFYVHDDKDKDKDRHPVGLRAWTIGQPSS